MLLSEVCGVVNAALLDFYERALRDRGVGRGNAAEFSESESESEMPSADSNGSKRRRKLQTGIITVVQRTSSDPRFNPHSYSIALNGVLAAEPDGPPQ